MWVVTVLDHEGNVRVYGPFETADEADDWADAEFPEAHHGDCDPEVTKVLEVR